jgi:hypothetical protein
MQGPSLYFPAPGLPPEAFPGSFHPSARGEQILGQLINQEIQNGPPPS